jgi:protein gp37
LDLTGIGWVIAGGESGSGYRPVKLSWIAGIRDLCAAEEVPFFFKQWGGRTPKEGGREIDGQTWSQTPAHPATAV